MIKLLLACLVLIFTNLVVPLSALAQTSPGEITSVYKIIDSEAVDGDIIESSADGMTRAKDSYATRMFGVLQFKPTVVYKSFDESLKPITRIGQAQVNVTTLNGEIAAGDYITSSPVAGKGQKATQAGYVIGIALTGLSEGGGSKLTYQGREITQAKITVAVKVDYSEISQFGLSSPDSLLSALFRNLENPSSFVITIRYIGAMLIILLSFALGFFAFSRSLPKAVEAIGRNPLATRSIHISMLINMALTLGAIVIGLIAALIIIRL